MRVNLRAVNDEDIVLILETQLHATLDQFLPSRLAQTISVTCL